MIKQETIRVAGSVMYCDVCGKRGPQAPGDDPGEVITIAMFNEWETSDERDVCPKCKDA